MSIVHSLASQQGRNDEQPNIELAERLVQERDHSGIKEVMENLHNKDKKIQSDCIKVAYEIGERDPGLISNYVLSFIELLKSGQNRMVWGAMSALSTIADQVPDTLVQHLSPILSAMKTGSVITVDKGVLTLAKLASVHESNNEKVFPSLIEHLKNCRVKEIPQHAESTMVAVNEQNKEAFIEVLQEREEYLTAPQLKRVKRIYKKLGVS
ncbi:hypothetical protein ACSVDE_01140 [Pseudalkalibacillus sp. Hm43]|uniref:hypothetical protein n=1 Tax=Pseudalkalibacillus sp. Hm43 TaxID=3450742 RepID=UPI003F430DDE